MENQLAGIPSTRDRLRSMISPSFAAKIQCIRYPGNILSIRAFFVDRFLRSFFIRSQSSMPPSIYF
jgi:hypothetical protein